MKAWSGGPHETKDTTTLGQLYQMINALHDLGYDIDTPVTLLYDDDHVWLETVERDHPQKRAPRVVDALGDNEKDAEWVDVDGDGHKWNGYEWQWRWSGDDPIIWRPEGAVDRISYFPYTEIT